jgi:hypothetical protein
VPTPKASIGAPESSSAAISNSSRLPLPTIFVAAQPPASRIARTSRANPARSPLSSRTASTFTPLATRSTTVRAARGVS